jgi:hypothetical protein
MPSDTVVEHSTFNPNIEGLKIPLVMNCGTVVKHSTHNPKIKGSNQPLAQGEIKWKKC